ncbi:GNAT family N-acetyltransferase [Aeromicrobium sp. YIM 150415]|uniref:bifunctional acetate--CoA ligase family protein/GNAT family N-acetyltransferase n=1 Tax=Aeromicrobium sp. YIM 150415 TaxID=2803912 RepID=UPI00196239DD|nr:bifunctional GNAT family N-acetyltransferase/acetate--CoA ligase family protein [Aeromicrobium sp. YIM 150415]MBM9462659.1 GNAT family N-acetyltransferase [Aeromicrobium sp. YIM 150415]
MTSQLHPVESWEADVLLKDGRVAQIRPIVPEDAEAFVAFYARVSAESKYFRFFAPYPRLSDRDVKRFTEVDHIKRVAFVVTQQDDIIAVGRYDATSPTEAEVAFLVEDAHQGRGVGQLLLEHLAQAGRERGITEFTAEVLPENIRMMQVFREMGYTVSGQLEDGVQQLRFRIDPTQSALGVMRAREQRAEAASIHRIFDASSIAVVGASRRQSSIGQMIVRNLVLGDFGGAVYAVNSQAEAVSGLPAYPSVQDIPGEVEIAIVAVPAESVNDVVLDCAAKGVHGLIVISAGFAEAGPEGRERQEELVHLCRSHGMRLIGPNCLGIINTVPRVQLNASLAPTMPPQGRVGFFCQSGALGTAILETVSRRGLGLSTFVSAGNRADVSGNDLLQYWSNDDATEVVLLYLESIGNPRKFSRLARRVSERKPVVAVKSGRSTQGVPVGHRVKRTSAPQKAVDAMFGQAGVIQVDTLDEMFDVAQLLAHQPLPRGNRIAVVGNSDAVALIVSDAAKAQGMQVAPPIPLGALAGAEEFEVALEAALARTDVDALVVVYTPPINTGGEDVANVLAAIGEQSDKPIVSTFLASKGIPVLLRVPDVQGGSAGRGSVPSYASPEAAVRALARAVNYAEWASRDHGEYHDSGQYRTGDARALIRSVLEMAPRGAVLSTEQVHFLLSCYGVDLWTWIIVHTREEAVAAGESLGWDVVLKAGSEHLRARPDLAHVWRGIHDADDMAEAWDSLTTWAGVDDESTFFVQRSAPEGVPVSFKAVEDPLFGPLVSFGLAGAPSELLDDRTYGIPPLTDVDAEQMVRGVRAAPMLFGYRGSPAVDVDGLRDVILRIAALKDDLPEVAELDLEPVSATPNGFVALSARVKVVPSNDRRGEWYVRRLSKPVTSNDTLTR